MAINSPLLARILGPQYLAAYAAWAAVGYSVMHAAPAWPAVGPIPAVTAAEGLLVGFVAAFILTGTGSRDNGGASLAACGPAHAVLVGTTFGLLWLGPSDLTPILLIVVAAVLAAAFRPMAAAAVLAAINAGFLWVLAHRWQVGDPWFTLLIYGSFQAFAAVTAGARVRAEAVAEELRQVNAGLLATRALLAESARDSERLRVSRELHDVAGHKLTALALNLEVLAHDGPEAARRELHIARQLATELLSDVRTVVSHLRHGDGLDIREALRRIVEPFPQSGIHLEVHEDVRVDGAERADALVRACQEALTNALRHAKADNVWISLTPSDGGLELVVRDDGAYTGSHEVGSGLAGMRERVTETGGTVSTGRGEAGGFRLTVRLPRRVQG